MTVRPCLGLSSASPPPSRSLQLLLEQPYIRDPNMNVDELVKSYVAKLGENIKVARFVRFNLGDTNTDADEEE